MTILTNLASLRQLSVTGIGSLRRLRGGELTRRLLPFAVVILAVLWLIELLVSVGAIPNLLFIGSYQADLIAVLFWLSVVGTLIICLGVLCAIWIDASLLRAHVVEREQQSAAYRDFLRRLDHEMRSPVTTMRIGLLNIQQGLPVEQHESLNRIVQQTQRLQKLTEELRYLTEIEEYQVEQTPVDLQDILKTAIELACSVPENENRTVDLQLQQVPWRVPDVAGDPELLLVVIRNLLDNSLKYTQATDKVVIRVYEDGHMALVEIADTGIGIHPDDLGHIFEDLYRGQNAQGLPGTGLGLALVQRIVHVHRGRIEINSRLAQGTIIRLWLPLANVV
jgi:two-component system OmpR family sensor kinase